MNNLNKTSSVRGIIWLIVIIILAITGYSYLQYKDKYPSTKDAYIQADTVNISAQITGPVTKIYVSDHQKVKKGQLLFEIDQRPFQYAVNKAKAAFLLTTQQVEAAKAAVLEAQANLKNATSQLSVAKQNVPRTLTLVSKGKMSKSMGVDAQGQLDSAKAAFDAAQSKLEEAKENLGKTGQDNARLLEAKANLDQANLNLQHTKITAPAKGSLVNFNLRPGTMVPAGRSLFTIVEDLKWWVNANYKETDLLRIRQGQKATIVVDLYPNHTFHGYVQSISTGSGSSFSLLPAENATGNWVKVTQRFQVKVIITDPVTKYPLRIGASSTVTIDTTNKN